MRESLTGNLLVASSLVDDPMYGGGVCLIVHQDESKVIGVMLNRPMKPSAEALLAMLGNSHTGSSEQREAADVNNRLVFDESTANPEAVDEVPALDDQDVRVDESIPSESSPLRMLHFGGPLSGPVVAIHQVSQFAEAETGSGIYVAAQKQHLENLMRGEASPYRLIVGHLSWESEQLETEIDSGIWHVVPATVDVVFSTANEMWPQLIRRATSNSLARWIGVPDVVGASEFN